MTRVLAALLAASPAAAETPATPPTPPTAPAPALTAGAGPGALGTFYAEAETWLLAGLMSPPDLPLRLRALAPAERLLAIAYLRRLGLYDGHPLDLDMLLTARIDTATLDAAAPHPAAAGTGTGQ